MNENISAYISLEKGENGQEIISSYENTLYGNVCCGDIAIANRFGFYQVKGFNKQGETYRFGYKTNSDSFLFETSWYNDVVDAAFEMVCWLKKEEYI